MIKISKFKVDFNKKKKKIDIKKRKNSVKLKNIEKNNILCRQNQKKIV